MSIPITLISNNPNDTLTFEHHIAVGDASDSSDITYDKIYTIKANQPTELGIRPYNILAIYNSPVKINLPSFRGVLAQPQGASAYTTGVYYVPIGTTEIKVEKLSSKKLGENSRDLSYLFFVFLVIILLYLIYRQNCK